MDSPDTDRRGRVEPAFDLETKSLSPDPEVDVARRQEAESVVQMAEEALAENVPEESEDERDAQLLPAGQRRRAPVAGRTRVSPSNVDRVDGHVPFGDLQERLATQARQLLLTEVEVSVDIDQPSQPVIITYEFDQPVREAENVAGDLYVVYTGSQKVPFQAGQSAERIVQVVRPEDFSGQPPIVEEEATLSVSGKKAKWTLAEDN